MQSRVRLSAQQTRGQADERYDTFLGSVCCQMQPCKTFSQIVFIYGKGILPHNLPRDCYPQDRAAEGNHSPLPKAQGSHEQ